MDDSEPLEYADEEEDNVNKPKRKLDSLGSMTGEFLMFSNLKMAFLLFIVYILLSSDIYMNNVLGKMNGTTSFGVNMTEKGVIVTSIILVILFIVLENLSKKNII